jgi:hypothetical protein
MEAKQVEKLISLVESSNLDFKSEIDLDSKRGKTDFLVEVLGLANAVDKPAFLVLGIEDNPRKVLGLPEDITEERLLKTISDNCRPPMKCSFNTVDHKGKQVGILTIDGSNRPYVLKKDLGFQDERGKQHIYTDKQVFIRRGSTGDIASPDEVIEMAVERDSKNDFEGIEEELDRISSKLTYVIRSIGDLRDKYDRERAIEYSFIGISSGLLVGILQTRGLQWELSIAGMFLSTFWISVFASSLRIVRFGWLRCILVSLAISTVFVILSVLFDKFAFQILNQLGFPESSNIIWTGIKGMVGGFAAAFLGRGELEYDW